ncbi:RNA-directed DNA polymerase, eukaryota [Tanacetum coccineum]
MEEMDDMVVRSVWGNMDFEYSYSPLVDYFVLVEGIWKPMGSKLLMVGIYAPQDLCEKRMLWNYLHEVLSRWQGEAIVMGDFNEVRFPSERHGLVFNKECDVNYGPIPFKMFHSWFDIEGFEQLVKDSWHNDVVIDLNEMSCLKKKFQMLKKKIKIWGKQNRIKANDKRNEILEKLLNIDKQIDQAGGQEDLLNSRKDLWKELRDLDTLREKDLVQKEKVKWAIEGDESSKYFHGIINKKRHQMAIRGVSVNGEWVVDPPKVKKEFFQHFSNQFSCCPSHHIRFLNEEVFPVSLNKHQHDMLEKEVTDVEIQKAVRDCGRNKSPRHDGFTFEFIRKFWEVIGGDEFRPISLIGCHYKIVGKIFMNRLSSVIGSLVSKEQSAFIRGRQILDGPMILISKGVIKRLKSCRSSFFRGMEPGTRKVSWFSWDSVVASKEVSIIKLPTRFNMSLRGLEVPSIDCPVCHEGVETSDHLFFSCSVDSSIVARVLGWWGLPNIGISSYHGWLNWFDGLRLRKEVKDYLEGTMFISWWIIWNYRNKLIFSSDVPTKASLFDLIVYHSFVWCNARARRKLEWLGWLKSPMTALL